MFEMHRRFESVYALKIEILTKLNNSVFETNGRFDRMNAIKIAIKLKMNNSVFPMHGRLKDLNYSVYEMEGWFD